MPDLASYKLKSEIKQGFLVRSFTVRLHFAVRKMSITLLIILSGNLIKNNKLKLSYMKKNQLSRL